MSAELISFHLSCVPQLRKILERFNLLFYGYGCKASLLATLFPEAKVFDLRLQRLGDIVEELVLDGLHSNKNANMSDIDKRLARNSETLVLVLINFDFNLIELQNLRHIKIIATVENIDFKFDQNDVLLFDFIFRDLTTFIDYPDDSLNAGITSDRISSTILLLESIPSKSKAIFKALLTQGSCQVAVLYELVKVPLLLGRKRMVTEALQEFIEHNIVKFKNGSSLIINLTKEERQEILSSEACKKIDVDFQRLKLL